MTTRDQFERANQLVPAIKQQLKELWQNEEAAKHEPEKQALREQIEGLERELKKLEAMIEAWQNQARLLEILAAVRELARDDFDIVIDIDDPDDTSKLVLEMNGDITLKENEGTVSKTFIRGGEDLPMEHAMLTSVLEFIAKWSSAQVEAHK